jgi:DNA transformation protein
MPISGQFASYVLEQLTHVAAVTGRRMFGGLGIYGDGRFFAIVHDDVVYFRVDDSNRADFERAGMHPFKPFVHKPITMQYYELPASVLEDEEELAHRVWKSLQAAGRTSPKRRAARRHADARARARSHSLRTRP